jgi:FkbM family methyltransferase
MLGIGHSLYIASLQSKTKKYILVGMKLNGSLSKLAVTASAFKRTPQLRYSTADRASLVAALWSKGHEANLLGFHLHYLGGSQFRYLVWEIFLRGEYLFEAENDAPVILDCGANIGLATLFFKRLYPKARISSFEADPTAASILKKNIALNSLRDVTAYNLMLSDEMGERPFYIDANVDGGLTMSSDPSFLSNRREIRVNTGKLSDFIAGPVDLLKMDIEGSEFDVVCELRDSGKISQIRQMIIEYHHKVGGQASRLGKFLELLEESGFEYQISGQCFPITKQDTFQGIMIGAYRPDVN